MKISRCITALAASAAMLLQAVPIQGSSITQQIYVPPVTKAVYADSSGDVVSGADYTLMVRLSGKYVTAASDGNIHQWEKLSGKSQHWKIISNRDGTCRILSAEDSSLAMTVKNGDSTNGNTIYLSEYTGSAAQHFILHRTDDAYYITGACSGNAALDVYDISHDNGADIDQWDYWGGEGQKFYIRPVENEYRLISGDLNFDGVVDTYDRIVMEKAVRFGADEILKQVADVNFDGIVNEKDFSMLSDFLLGKKTYMQSYCDIPCSKPDAAYLFAYFLGNAPEQERLSYAISLDGYNFRALNGGKAVWGSSTGTKCIRDPYIFKGEDGLYYMLATDMKSSLGWNSNRNLLSAKSTDLVHWFDESIIEIANKYPNMQGADRAWAPQAIYDPAKGSYMIYFAARVPGTDDRTIMYYAYSKDMKKLDTTPQILFAPANGNDAIDSDIIFENSKYYMYYKNETNKRIYLAESGNASGPYKEIKQVSEGNIGVEGPNIYKKLDSDEWLMMSDAYGNGYYVMQSTTDLENFTTVSRNSYSFDFTPRHGYVIPINADQYTALANALPSAGLPPLNTGIEEKVQHVGYGCKTVGVGTVNARFSNGVTKEMQVDWNKDDIARVDTGSPGVYKVRGKIAKPVDGYANPFIEERADPYIVNGENGYYYFTASYPAYGSVDKGYDRIVLRCSYKVEGLANAEEKTIWQAHSSGIMAKHIWAPEMHKIGGVWYIFFAAGASSDVWAIRPYVLKCTGDNPYLDSWIECGQMQASSGDTSSFTSFSLDMTYFENNGKHYVIWAEIKGDSSLFMAEIDPREPWKLTSKPILLTKPEYSWELVNHRVNEGPAVLKTDKKIYVYFSASGTGSEYCMGRMEADINSDLMDISSWKKLDHPVLSTADLSGESGPGHNCFVWNEMGELLCVYHSRPASHASKGCGTYASDPLYDPCRHTRIRKVTFVNDEPVIDTLSDAVIAPPFREVTATVIVDDPNYPEY